jgi:hypothetical protein
MTSWQPRPNDEILEDAQRVVDGFITTHRSAAIPALMATCVAWAVENGGGDLVRQTLANLTKMSVEMDAARKAAGQ